jgi:pilus assembly protein CpaB
MARSIAQVASGSNRNRGVLMLAALFGVLSATLMFAFLSTRGGGDEAVQDALHTAGEMETVLVFARDVEFGATITPDMLVEQSIPSGSVLPGVVTDPDEVVGKVTTTRIYAGEQALGAKVTTGDEQNSLAFKVPPGLRALSLQIPHEAWANAGLPQPGDRVDVLGITSLVTVDPLTGEEKLDLVSGIIAQDVMVVAVSQSLVPFGPAMTGTNGEALSESTGDSDTPPYRPLDDIATYEEAISITLALEPADAAKVAIIDAMKDDQGQYRIMTRYQGDREHLGGTITWTLDDVFVD